MIYKMVLFIVSVSRDSMFSFWKLETFIKTDID